MPEIRFFIYPPDDYTEGQISIRVFESVCPESDGIFSKFILHRLFIGFDRPGIVVQYHRRHSQDSRYDLPHHLAALLFALCRAVIDGGIQQPLADFVAENQFLLFGENVV